MRCKCCNNTMTNRNTQHKPTGKEDDLCGTCRYYAFHAQVEREYIGGAYPTEGVTQPRNYSE